MAKSSPSTDSEGPIGDRLQPALLDRLTDDEPTKATEAVDAAAMTRSRLRCAVLRDIAWILNTTNMESDTASELFPHARQSVVNFGVETLSGRRIADLDWHQLEQSIKDAVLTFEPRVLPHTLEVRVVHRPWPACTITMCWPSRSAASSGRCRIRWSSSCGPTSTSRAATWSCSNNRSAASPDGSATARLLQPRARLSAGAGARLPTSTRRSRRAWE